MLRAVQTISARHPCRLCRVPDASLLARSFQHSAGQVRPSAAIFRRLVPGQQLSRRWATSTTATSSIEDPAETEAQRLTDEGTTHLENGLVDKAKESYNQSINVKPTSTALFNLGVCHYSEKNLPEAIKCWEESHALSPSPDALTNLASAYAMSSPSRPDLAVEHLKTASKLSPEDVEISYNLATILEATEQLEEALVAYRRALEGGVERASENIRNVTAKIIGARAAAEAAEKEKEKEKQAKK